MAIKRNIVIVEDHKILREGLKAILANEPDYEVVGEASNGIEAIHVIRRTRPDLVLLDLSMPKMDGFSVLRDIKGSFPEIKIMVLTIHESRDHVVEAFKAGADAYCVKDASRAELRAALRSTLEGKMYMSPVVSQAVLEGYLCGTRVPSPNKARDVLTLREREILKLLAEGHQNKEIARLLNISVKTVEKHRSNLMQKLDLHNAAQLAVYACEQGLVTKEVDGTTPMK
jgi:DNA-binding NarL/FixJ family response regulator